jgi:hypothetical protein
MGQFKLNIWRKEALPDGGRKRAEEGGFVVFLVRDILMSMETYAFSISYVVSMLALYDGSSLGSYLHFEPHA